LLIELSIVRYVTNRTLNLPVRLTKNISLVYKQHVSHSASISNFSYMQIL